MRVETVHHATETRLESDCAFKIDATVEFEPGRTDCEAEGKVLAGLLFERLPGGTIDALVAELRRRSERIGYDLNRESWR